MADISSVDLDRVASDDLEQASPELLRAMVRTFAEARIGADADAICGVPYGQVSKDRVNCRSGYRDRRRDTRAGTIELGSRGCVRTRISRIGCWSGGADPSRR